MVPGFSLLYITYAPKKKKLSLIISLCSFLYPLRVPLSFSVGILGMADIEKKYGNETCENKKEGKGLERWPGSSS